MTPWVSWQTVALFLYASSVCQQRLISREPAVRLEPPGRGCADGCRGSDARGSSKRDAAKRVASGACNAPTKDATRGAVRPRFFRHRSQSGGNAMADALSEVSSRCCMSSKVVLSARELLPQARICGRDRASKGLSG